MTPSPKGPQPIPTAETAPYWRAALEGRLEIQYCRACARHQFYPRRFCTQCLSDQIDWVQASGRGRIYTYTICHVAAHPAFEARVPYAIGMIELEENVRLLAGIVDSDVEQLRVGVPVEVCFERISDDIALPMFRLSHQPI
ncbi:Zn-ribbon domain-containing OB-fold protein [Bradyrhizobium sp. AUGA SZCCT0042]|uniref:Zn-ribbon domain-containing OB-fold protein n=1 Tax=Bradyrhizobium sp. AUGA SZCCT0042 TaxID=2807651 RepID=UPI001BA9DA24|nr:Zn-ribbon domain-containing OB-fold protein [Bradyrhizobium sp. AUGA SZCCT0042]MBR1301258.1 Zn-ribbon domain-containing OB-fold protein [Bradyrhizobium sp. AUGA SZCCT0042]